MTESNPDSDDSSIIPQKHGSSPFSSELPLRITLSDGDYNNAWDKSLSIKMSQVTCAILMMIASENQTIFLGRRSIQV